MVGKQARDEEEVARACSPDHKLLLGFVFPNLSLLAVKGRQNWLWARETSLICSGTPPPPAVAGLLIVCGERPRSAANPLYPPLWCSATGARNMVCYFARA